ncbi:MAG: HAD-IA family hydrolase [Desulfobaccales bacterium]|nr:HAD-IA family hydrolase [Desulfobaccales bacterium]
MVACKVIIYDCDGVLIDSRLSNEAFYNHILKRFGLPLLSQEQVDFIQVSTAWQAIDYLFQDTPWLAAAQAYQQNLDNRPFLSRLRLMPQVREVLEYLRPTYRTAIATNRGKSLPLVLKELGLADLFDLTVSCYDVSQPKPHPECLAKILRHFKVKPGETLYIGDAAVDRLTSLAAGVPFAAYQNPELKADYHLKEHLDLLKVLNV